MKRALFHDIDTIRLRIFDQCPYVGSREHCILVVLHKLVPVGWLCIHTFPCGKISTTETTTRIRNRGKLRMATFQLIRKQLVVLVHFIRRPNKIKFPVVTCVNKRSWNLSWWYRLRFLHGTRATLAHLRYNAHADRTRLRVTIVLI